MAFLQGGQNAKSAILNRHWAGLGPLRQPSGVAHALKGMSVPKKRVLGWHEDSRQPKDIAMPAGFGQCGGLGRVGGSQKGGERGQGKGSPMDKQALGRGQSTDLHILS